MNDLEITRLLKNCPITRNKFIGTLTPDRLPKNVKKREYALIINTVSDPAIMGHWCSLYVKGRSAWFFDSYGRSVKLIPELDKWCKARFTRIFYNKRSEQKPTSNVCGAFAIFATYEMCRGASFQSIVGRFKRIKNDDAWVSAWLRRRLGFSINTRR